MISMSVANMMVGLVETGRIAPEGAEGAEGADRRNHSKQRKAIFGFVHRMLAALEANRQIAALESEMKRLAALSPHLLDDIGLADEAVKTAADTKASGFDIQPIRTEAPVAEARKRKDRRSSAVFTAAPQRRNAIGRVHRATLPAPTGSQAVA
jgi:hypothetical protein